MLMHDSPSFRIYFGNADDCLSKSDYSAPVTSGALLDLKSCINVRRLLNLKHIFFPHQIHGATGLLVTSEMVFGNRSFSLEADFLITKQPMIGIGIMSADCLPIIFYDTLHHVVGIAHAGWRGSVAGIAVKMLEMMRNKFNTTPDQLQIFFGPSAKICCYQVSKEFHQQLEAYSFADQTLQAHGYGTFFDLPGFNRLLLESVGVKKEAFHVGYNICTICDSRFCSVRREGPDAGRQITVVSLK